MLAGQFEKIAVYFSQLLKYEGDVNDLRIIFSVLGIILIYGYYPVRFEILKRRLKVRDEKLKEVASELRNIFCNILGDQLKRRDLKLFVRRFEKRKFYRKKFMEWFDRKKIYFDVKNIDFLNYEGKSDSFGFEVSPVPRGLIGVSYTIGKILVDDNLRERAEVFNLSNDYKSIAAIANVDFAIVKPFYEGKKISWFLTFDTEQDVEIPPESKKRIELTIGYYSDLFSKLLYNIK
tara:strand:- start:118 stop:819 length:702 start_codon:yes stop_codon:yes gene_type:complete